MHRRSQFNTHKDRVRIVTGWSHPGDLGSGRDGDPFFQRTTLHLDEILPGDQIKVLNHPAYRGLAVEGEAWQLENSIVGAIRGINLPQDIEVQGHGLGPSHFRNMQADLVGRVRLGLKLARESLRRNNNEAVTLAQARDLAGQTYVHSLRYDGTIEDNEDVFHAPLEFRNELADRGRAAFELRWLLVDEEKDFSPDPIVRAKFLAPHVNVGPPGAEVSDNKSSYRTWELPWVRNVRVNVAGSYAEVSGENLRSGVVRSVQFVASPRDYYDADTGTLVPMSSYRKAVLGRWGTGGNTAEMPVRDFACGSEGKCLTVNVPAFVIPPGLVGQPLYWSIVLRVSMFDPTLPELERYLGPAAGYSTQPIQWFEDTLSDSNPKHAIVKNLVASMQFSIRAPMSFHWPPNAGSSGWLEFEDYATQSPPNDPTAFQVEGHQFFNVIHFPLYRRGPSGTYVPFQIPLLTHADGTLNKEDAATGILGRFYNEYAAHGTIDVIRPKHYEP